jgi:hypothetical protein
MLFQESYNEQGDALREFYLYDTIQGQIVFQCPVQQPWNVLFQWSPDSRQVIYGTDEGSLLLLDIPSGKVAELDIENVKDLESEFDQIVCTGVLILRKVEPDTPRPFKTASASLMRRGRLEAPITPMGPRLLAYNDTGSLEHLKPKPEQPQQEAHEQTKDQAAPADAGVATVAPAAESPPSEPTLEPAASEAPAGPTNGVEELVAPE